jgi:hypothetical protein
MNNLFGTMTNIKNENYEKKLIKGIDYSYDHYSSKTPKENINNMMNNESRNLIQARKTSSD